MTPKKPKSYNADFSIDMTDVLSKSKSKSKSDFNIDMTGMLKNSGDLNISKKNIKRSKPKSKKVKEESPKKIKDIVNDISIGEFSIDLIGVIKKDEIDEKEINKKESLNEKSSKIITKINNIVNNYDVNNNKLSSKMLDLFNSLNDSMLLLDEKASKISNIATVTTNETDKKLIEDFTAVYEKSFQEINNLSENILKNNTGLDKDLNEKNIKQIKNNLSKILETFDNVFEFITTKGLYARNTDAKTIAHGIQNLRDDIVNSISLINEKEKIKTKTIKDISDIGNESDDVEIKNIVKTTNRSIETGLFNKREKYLNDMASRFFNIRDDELDTLNDIKKHLKINYELENTDNIMTRNLNDILNEFIKNREKVFSQEENAENISSTLNKLLALQEISEKHKDIFNDRDKEKFNKNFENIVKKLSDMETSNEKNNQSNSNVFGNIIKYFGAGLKIPILEKFGESLPDLFKSKKEEDPYKKEREDILEEMFYSIKKYGIKTADAITELKDYELSDEREDDKEIRKESKADEENSETNKLGFLGIKKSLDSINDSLLDNEKDDDKDSIFSMLLTKGLKTLLPAAIGLFTSPAVLAAFSVIIAGLIGVYLGKNASKLLNFFKNLNDTKNTNKDNEKETAKEAILNLQYTNPKVYEKLQNEVVSKYKDALSPQLSENMKAKIAKTYMDSDSFISDMRDAAWEYSQETGAENNYKPLIGATPFSQNNNNLENNIKDSLIESVDDVASEIKAGESKGPIIIPVPTPQNQQQMQPNNSRADNMNTGSTITDDSIQLKMLEIGIF